MTIRLASLILVALLLSAASAAADRAAVPAPDFSWGPGCPKPAAQQLAESESAWRQAISAKLFPQPSSGGAVTAIDEGYLRRLLARPDFAELAPRLLDAAMHSESSLDTCRIHYEAAAGALPSSRKEAALQGLRTALHCARARTRLAVAIARAGISVKMASSQSASYSFQAMESSVDALKDAAEEASGCPACPGLAERIRRLRSVLLDAWERAERSKDLSLIGSLDLRSIYSGAFPEPSGRNPGKQ